MTVFCDDQFYPNADDTAKSYYTLEKCRENSEELFYRKRYFNDWCGLDSDMLVISTNDLLSTTFVSVLNKLKGEIPPLISVKKGSHAYFTKDHARCFCAGKDIHGMMNPTKHF